MIFRGTVAWLIVFVLGWTVYATVFELEMEQIGIAEDELRQRSELLARLQHLPEREAQIKEQMEELSSIAAEKYLYQGDEKEAQALILRDVRALATRSNVRIDSMRSLALRKSTNLISRSAIQANFTATHDDLLTLLAEIEAWEPLLRVERISVRTRRASTLDSPAQLAVLVEVSGFYESARGPAV